MFHTPKAISAEPKDAPANTLGIRRIMFAVDDIEDVVARLRLSGPLGITSKLVMTCYLWRLTSVRCACRIAVSKPRCPTSKYGSAASPQS
jgi:hypothetical protein